MVLRKERNTTAPTDGSNSLSSTPASMPISVSVSSRVMTSNEQPVSKRQRIDSGNSPSNDTNKSASTSSSSSSLCLSNEQDIPTSDILICPSGTTSASSSPPLSSVGCHLFVNKNLVNYNSSSCSSSNISDNSSNISSSHNSSLDEVDKVIVTTTTNQVMPDLLCLNEKHDYDNGMKEFEKYLLRQCLCGVSQQELVAPFQKFYKNVANQSQNRHNGSNGNCNLLSKQRGVPLSEWPTMKLIQFLSTLQLLFDIYLKQNSKGFICSRIIYICDDIIDNHYHHHHHHHQHHQQQDNVNNSDDFSVNLIEEIVELGCNLQLNKQNKYVQFLCNRLLSSFLVILTSRSAVTSLTPTSLNDDIDNCWLIKKLVDNLFLFENLDHISVYQISFSLEIIKRIVEWKDIEIHPLDDDEKSLDERVDSAHSNNTEQPSTSRGGTVIFEPQQPRLENNYFAIHFNNELDASTSSGGHTDKLTSSTNNKQRLKIQQQTQNVSDDESNHQQTCHLITLTDSESFDTTQLKCQTIKILENKWPALVKTMSNLILTHQNNLETAQIIKNYTSQQRNYLSSSSNTNEMLRTEEIENCIITFLSLWENIISVKANLSIVETLPFYSQLDNFELLLTQQLSCTIYKQMLSLFNEALCYGSTLALQDLLPEETCQLVHRIVRHVKDYRMLDCLPRKKIENDCGFIGYQGRTVVYERDSFVHSTELSSDNDNEDIIHTNCTDIDKTLLQKLVLLILKSVAVTVKEIRCDSSDSSIDSTDYDAVRDLIVIEHSIRDVMKKVETFIKNKMDFHPDCHFSKILIHLFDDQDDYLIEAMVCTLDITTGISFRNNAFPELVQMLNPVYTFLEFLKMISNSSDLLLDLLVSNETCFLLYLLRFLKYIRTNWSMFTQSCQEFNGGRNMIVNTTLDDAMSVLIRLRLQISRLVSKSLYPYDISPVLRLLESCESLYEGNELS